MEVRLRKDFYGTKLPKVSSDSIRVTVSFNYKGPAQTLSIETNTGKRGLWGDYDQESPTYHDSKYVSKSDIFRSYTFSRSIPLSFWGSRKIEDCAVEVVIRGEGIHEDAVIWDAYTVNIAVEKYTLTTEVSPSGAGYIVPSSGTYAAGTKVTITAYSYSGWDFNYWGGDASGILSSTTITMDSNKHAIAYFRLKGL